MTLNASTIPPLITNIVRLMETKCIRLNSDTLPNWRAMFADVLHELTACEQHQHFEERVNRILARGGLSHVAFFHDSAARAPARYAICATCCWATPSTVPRWIFQDVHEGGPAHTAGVRAGDVLIAVDGSPVSPPILPTFSLGKDTVLTIENHSHGVQQVTAVLPRPDPNGKGKGQPPMAEPTSVTSRRVGEEIGYVRVAFFPGANGERFARDLSRTLDQLAGCTRLIVDLRGNLGSFVGSLRLMSYLTPGRMPIGYSMTRRGEDRRWRREQLPCVDTLPDTKAQILKMAIRFLVLNRDRSVRLMTEGLGAQPFHGRTVILINEHTASAAEMVVAFAAENQLAPLVGTTTAGQVLGGANFAVGQGFVLRLPAAGWYTWQGNIVEGRGVSPTVEVPLDIEALQRGKDNQFEQALNMARGM